MCGIYGFSYSSPVKLQQLVDGLKRLEYRGYDSWGFAVLNRERVLVHKQVGKVSEGRIMGQPTQTRLGIAHTRWATHGGVTRVNSHPHASCEGRFHVVHNGIIENCSQVKLQLSRTHRFVSETDTELLGHLLEEIVTTSLDLAVMAKLASRITGNNAVVVLDTRDQVLAGYRHGSPLLIGKHPRGTEIASDSAAFSRQVTNYTVLEDGTCVWVQGKKVLWAGGQADQKERTWFKLNQDHTRHTKTGFTHYMLKEIYEQPDVIRRIATQYNTIKRLKIKRSKPIIIVGSGTALFAAQKGAYLLEARGIECLAIPGTMLPIYQKRLKRVYVLALSQSGETIDTLEAVTLATREGAHTGALVNVTHSTLAREVLDVLPLQAGQERAVASTKAFMAMLTWLWLLDQKVADNLAKGHKTLLTTADGLKLLFTDKDWTGEVRKVSRLIAKSKSMFVLATGQNVTLAYEAALKIKEVSYIHAEGLLASELKHGVIALIEPGTPCVVLQQDPGDEGAITAAIELSSRGATIIGIALNTHPSFDHFIPLQSQSTFGRLAELVVTFQMIAYMTAVKRKLDPDMPRNLAKSVTVK